MLAPLLDKMIFRDVANRFTAAEALQFFEEMYSGLTEDQLEFKEFTHPLGYTFYDNYERWRDLPEDFRQKWTAYRQPPLSLTTRALRAICITILCLLFVGFSPSSCPLLDLYGPAS
jgi:hypothetical protein